MSAVLFCSCDVDHFAGQRPVEKPNSHWVCEEYNISFSVGEKYERYDSLIQINGKLIPFTFLWFDFYNNVNINFEVGGETVVLEGIGEFGSEVFSIYIADTKGYYPTEEVTLEFERVK